uniref:Uncharacterized protein n=1 Tax=Wuchereria bancrofti TaxID=6293 RepID=A0A1I8EGD3_WUCBA
MINEDKMKGKANNRLSDVTVVKTDEYFFLDFFGWILKKVLSFIIYHLNLHLGVNRGFCGNCDRCEDRPVRCDVVGVLLDTWLPSICASLKRVISIWNLNELVSIVVEYR